MVCQPGRFLLSYKGYHPAIFENNPYIVEMGDHEGQLVDTDYGYGLSGFNRDGRYMGGAGRPYHFIHAFVEDLSKKLGVYIELQDFRPDLYLSDAEREPWPGLPEHYVYLNCGRKADFTAKLYSTHRFQQMVNALHKEIAFVQVGAANDFHPVLENTINLVGQTNLRQTMQIMHRATAVVTANSFPMHLAAGVPTPTGALRPCIVLAGQREQAQWCRYPGHTLLGTDGRLKKCPVLPAMACWRNKVVKVDSDNSVCWAPMADEVGQPIPECLHRVSADDLIRAVRAWL